MKNKIILLLIILLTTSTNVFASDGSDTTIKDSLDNINQYTTNFFTPHIKKLVVEEPDYSTKESVDVQSSGTLAPVKRLRLQIKKDLRDKKAKANGIKTEQIVDVVPTQDQALLDCDQMEYFAPRTELEANGNVVMFFPQNNSTIKADKMIYNQTSNVINAYGHVILISDGKVLNGDYMHIDMNEENALMDNPVTDYLQIRARAKKGYMYGDKLIQENGDLLVTKKTMINIKSDMFGPDLDQMYVEDKDKSYYKKDSHGEKFRIKTNELIINSKKEHDDITLKHAEVYFNERKVCTIPSITMHTNKAQDYAEANFPEIGTMTNMGFYVGPGFVFDTPHGSTLKLTPVLNYQGNGDDSGDNSFGWGGVAKFKSATNKTDMYYGTANKIFMMRGYQKLDDDLFFQYGTNSYMDDWFMGFRMPKVLGELVYQDDAEFKDFLGKNKPFTYTHRITAGYAQDGDYTTGLFDNDNFTGTARFKYMAEGAQTLWQFSDNTKSAINANFSLVGQGAAALYGTGNTQTIARFGPRLHTQYKPWMQDIGYFLSAYDDKTPFNFDRYVYGRSNVYARESFRLCKYLTLSWFTSLNLSNDSWDGKTLQEDSFFFAIGPDDVKLNIGYDTVRQQSFVTMTMHLDAKGSKIEYNKMVIKNPDTLGKSEQKEKDKGLYTTTTVTSGSQPSFIQVYNNETPVSNVEKAEVVNIEEAL